MTFFVYVSFGTVLESFRNGSETPEISKPFPDRFKTVPERFSNRTGTATEWIQNRSLTVLPQKNIARVPK